ncbi:MAG: hypothetical protein IPL63_03575 [Saprospiraceae bacterium]|nr:hypothetical protein [Saprospiraceae bacterium]MBK7523027.1 hypothetical protein [Saprospiraceae bacterium]MBK8081872.1 hypothetical protein [Saprospiraceae bacterium]MBK8370598.1 hypothetical protein [Saprospiraceae bacterium]MBK8546482.1 hypothetical protein [Saprospiraceae bacterium]
MAHPSSAHQADALKAFLKALKIKFEFSDEETYNPEFVEKILESKEQVKNGKVTRVKKENLKEFLGL